MPLKYLYIVLGGLSIALGVVGIFLPLLPTTPFLLLAAFFFSRSSEKLHRWLIEHPKLGPFITDWQKHGVIRTQPKVICTALLIVFIGYPVVFRDFPWSIKGISLGVSICVLIFIWSRPSKPVDAKGSDQ